MTRASHVEAAIAQAFGIPTDQVPAKLRELRADKATRSFTKLAAYLNRRGVLVGKSWLSEYLRNHPPA